MIECICRKIVCWKITASLDDAKAKQSELAAQAESDLAADETFVSLTDKASMAEAALERAEANLDEIEQDAARKLPGYEKSSLFKYLRDRKFGTEGYGKRGFTRRMDRMLAKFIDYGKARKSYEFLKNTPDQMRKIIADDREALDTVMGRTGKPTGFGLGATWAQSQSSTRLNNYRIVAKSNCSNSIKSAKESESLERELTDLEDTRGKVLPGSGGRFFATCLAEIETPDLSSKARSTPSLTDDQIVARIQGVDSEIENSGRSGSRLPRPIARDASMHSGSRSRNPTVQSFQV